MRPIDAPAPPRLPEAASAVRDAVDLKGEHACDDCGHVSPRWFGRCPGCRAWNSAKSVSDRPRAGEHAPATIVTLAPGGEPDRVPTSFGEFDRLLNGGLPRGGTVLLAGEPGIGKSTLVLQILGSARARGSSVLLLSGEEPLAQVAARAGRLGLDRDCPAATATSIPAAVGAIESAEAGLVVVDSLQAMSDSRAGPSSLRETASALVDVARRSGSALIIVGHVTKDGEVAGPRAVEHLVDVVMTLEGERSGTLRLLRLSKNRFGRCDETGVFVLGDRGLTAVADPSALLLADRNPGVPGCVVFPALEGTRSLMIEIQALVAPASGQPRRVASGISPRRLALLLAVLSRRARIHSSQLDVFVSAVGGMTIRDPSADLAICLALVSSARDIVCPPSVAVVGEVGLGGEVRNVPAIERRLREAGRLGFTHAFVPPSTEFSLSHPKLSRVPDVTSAVALLNEF